MVERNLGRHRLDHRFLDDRGAPVVREFAVELGLTQEVIAEKMSIGTGTVCRAEGGTASVIMIERIFDFLVDYEEGMDSGV